MERIITWTTTGKRIKSGNIQWLPTFQHTTKREAVHRMMGQKKPKTAIIRTGHDFAYITGDSD